MTKYFVSYSFNSVLGSGFEDTISIVNVIKLEDDSI